ncbi:MAG: PAS domain S-box protein [Methanosarcinales archaeon]|nr:MAG: PAS domain S-box protein [Methanosarcinales archaeon]
MQSAQRGGIVKITGDDYKQEPERRCKMFEIKKSELIGAYASNMGATSAEELIERKIKDAHLESKETYTREEIARVCSELMRVGGLIKILAQNFLVQLEYVAREELEKLVQERTRELTETNEALNRAKQYFQTLFSTMIDPVVIIDSKGVFVEATDNVEDVTGFTKEELLGGSFLETGIMTEESNAVISENLAKRMAGVNVAPCEVEVLTKDGRKLPFEVNAAQIIHINQPADMLIFRDITERKRLERELQQAFDRLKAAYEELSIPVIQVWAGVLVLPIIGVLDTERINRLMETMLTKIVETQSRVVIIDVTGVRSIDTNVANHLINVTKAAKLLGTRCIVTGIKPGTAHTLVGLGVDMSGITTKRSMQDGLKSALQIAGAGGLMSE